MKGLISLLFCQSIVFSQTQVELPKILPDDQIIRHFTYTLLYNEELEQADWVAFELIFNEVRGSAIRTNDYRPGPKVCTGSAMLQDYRGSVRKPDTF